MDTVRPIYRQAKVYGKTIYQTTKKVISDKFQNLNLLKKVSKLNKTMNSVRGLMNWIIIIFFFFDFGLKIFNPT